MNKKRRFYSEEEVQKIIADLKKKWVEERKGNVKFENGKITIISNDIENIKDLAKYLRAKWVEEIEKMKNPCEPKTNDLEDIRKTAGMNTIYNQAIEDILKELKKNKKEK